MTGGPGVGGGGPLGGPGATGAELLSDFANRPASDALIVLPKIKTKTKMILKKLQ